MSKFCFLVFTTLALQTFAGEWVYVRPELGVGFSDNVYQDDFNKKSDSYLWLSGATKYLDDDVSWIGRLSFNLYNKESVNNYAAYSLKRTSDLIQYDSDLTLGIGGLSYLKIDKGSTDESYNNFYATGYVTKTVKEDGPFTIDMETGVKATSYSQLDRRFDVVVFVGADSYWQVDNDTEINPYAELGIVFSNQAYYSKRYLDLGVIWNEKLDEYYRFSLDLYIRNSVYPNRQVSDILLTSNRRGRLSSRSIETRESVGVRQLSASLNRKTQGLELTAGISHAAENSVSELEKYTENQVYVSAVWEF